MDIKLIPIEKLLRDKDASYEDIIVCYGALRLGITNYGTQMSGDVQERINVNKGIIQKIDKELKRRG